MIQALITGINVNTPIHIAVGLMSRYITNPRKVAVMYIMAKLYTIYVHRFTVLPSYFFVLRTLPPLGSRTPTEAAPCGYLSSQANALSNPSPTVLAGYLSDVRCNAMYR